MSVNHHLFLTFCSAFAVLSSIGYTPAVAAPPELQTPAPVIYLADNLDEKDRLGWCIDTVGRGLSEHIHAHSCKPQGGDVQFSLDAGTGQLRSVAFDGKCVVVKEPADETVPFGLVECAETPAQTFVYDPKTMELHPADNEALCIVAGGGSRSAGPFMSRDLLLEECTATDAALKQWVIRP